MCATMASMSGPRRRPAAPAIALAIALACVGACVPQPVGRATGSPATSSGPPPTPTPTPVPTGPTPSPSFVRPTPTPLPTFLSYVVKSGDTLTSIARAHDTTARSIAFWNRTSIRRSTRIRPSTHPTASRSAGSCMLVPGTEIDEDETFPD